MGDDLALNVQEHSIQEEIPVIDTDITVEKDQNNRRASYPSIIWVINALNIAREQDKEILEGTDKIHQSETRLEPSGSGDDDDTLKNVPKGDDPMDKLEEMISD